MDELTPRQEKPSNTEVLGLLLDDEKLNYITNLNGPNIKGLCKLLYLTKRLSNPNVDPISIHDETIQYYLSLKCSLIQNKGNRADQIVDALKHIIEDENKDSISSLMSDIKK